MSTLAIIQARMGSTRLPGKVLRLLAGYPMLGHIVKRAQSVKQIDKVIVATSDRPGDLPIRQFCRRENIDVFAGSEYDVLDRFYQAACHYHGNPILRITADCPFVDPGIIEALLELYHSGHYDHVGVATGAGAIFLNAGRYPDGLDTECFSFQTLRRAWQEAESVEDREHVTPYIWRIPGRFLVGALTASQDYSHLRWTVDTEDDFQLVHQIYKALYTPHRSFLMEDILHYLQRHLEAADLNRSHIGHEGYSDIWQKDAPSDTHEKTEEVTT